jgi:hypothetical protein
MKLVRLVHRIGEVLEMETTLRELSSWFGKPSWGEAVDDVEPLQSETPAEPLRSADQEQLDQLKQGAAHWNQWRQAHSDIRPALRGADLSQADLTGAHLTGAHLHGADLHQAILSWTDLREADLGEADLHRANLSRADLSLADLREADLSEADLSGANLDEANLDGARQLTQRQLQPAFIDASTKLPGHINREELLQRKK